MKVNNNKNNLITYIIFICTLLLFLFQSLFQLIPIKLFNLNIDELSNIDKILLLTFSNLCTLVIVVLIYRKIIKKDLKDIKNTNKKDFYKNSIFCLKYWVLNLLIMYIFIYILRLLGINDSINNSNVKSLIKANPLIMGLNIIFISTVIEEIIFRLSFKTVFKEKIPFILISGIIFGGLHVLSINSLIELIYLIPYCTSGIILSYIYYETDNIFYSYFVHAFHNLILLIPELITLMEVIR